MGVILNKTEWYEKNIWNDGDIITANKLNNIENGIQESNIYSIFFSVDMSEGIVETCSATVNDLITAIQMGKQILSFCVVDNTGRMCSEGYEYIEEERIIFKFTNSTIAPGGLYYTILEIDSRYIDGQYSHWEVTDKTYVISDNGGK